MLPLRSTLAAVALLVLGAAPSPAPAGTGREDAMPPRAALRPNWRTMTFRGAVMSVPPGVVPLTATSFLFGVVEIDVPEDVAVEFNDQGEAVFTLADPASSHAFVVRVGEHRIVVGPRSRLVVPPPAVGKPRFESIPSAYRVPTPREFLDESYDLGDPFDASPYR